MPTLQSEAHAVEIAEKVSSALSLAGAFFVITTFLFDNRFRKSINRLVFYASWGNLFANIATLISRSGVLLGPNSSLCQFQAFMFQWFMPADALWTFAMACNVWLTFFRQHDAASLRRLEWRYICFCYGLPFIPALTYFFVRSAERGRVYGSAGLWCWVSSEWDVLRIATFYGPVWLFIIANAVIYIKVGTVVFKWRKKVITLNHQSSTTAPLSLEMRRMEHRVPAKTYQVQIHSQVPHSPDRGERVSHNKFQLEASLASPTIPEYRQSQVLSSTTREGPARPNTVVHHPAKADANKATISYCYTALLFFVALLCTWVPSTVNRLYTLNKPESRSPFALNFASGLVLPLQGFWNAVIYIVTSHRACKAMIGDITAFISTHASNGNNDNDNNFLGLPRSGKNKDGAQPLDSTDARADIVISIDGGNRITRHRSYASDFSATDIVPDLPSSTPVKIKMHDHHRHSSISDATTAGGFTLSRGHSLKSQKRSDRSSTDSLHIADQPDSGRHERIESDGSHIGFAR